MTGILFFVLAVLSARAPLSLLFAVLLHETGHVGTALLLGWGAPEVRMSVAGIRLCYHGTHSPLPSLAVSLSGSLFGALIFLLPFLPESLRLYSLGFSLANLLPVSCLDGGTALSSILEALMLPDRAYRIARAVSVTTVLLFWILTTVIQIKVGANLTLLAVSVYLTVSTLCEENR